MELHWKEIIPGDQYIVSIDGPMNEGDEKVLSFLYQPLIGPVCISLYFTLRNQVEQNRLSTEPISHYYIMNLMDMSLSEFFVARQKLEAIGLLDTYVKKGEDFRLFIYELKPPLSPFQFFSDGLLNIYLYQKIGRDYYQRLKQFFADKKLPLEEFDKVTKEFQDVFASATSAYALQNVSDDSFVNVRFPDKGEVEPIHVEPVDFDFDLLMAGLSDNLISKAAITPKVKDVILKLAFLYGIDPVQMVNIVLGAVTEKNTIDIETLRKEARDWYKLEHYSTLPKMVDKVQSPLLYSQKEEPKTMEEKLVRYLETTSPRELLTDLSEGSEPSAADLKLIEDIMIQQKLPPGVINVLIQYCLLRTDMKLSRNFVEKIASHWARKKVRTVQEAMNLAKEEHRKYSEWQKQKKERKSTSKAQPTRTERVPEWFENRERPKEEEMEITNFEEEKRKLEERLKKYRK